MYEDLPRLNNVPTISYNDIRLHMNHQMVQTLHLNKEFLRGGSIKILLVWANVHSEGIPQEEIRIDTTERNRHRMQGESIYMIRQDLRSSAILDLGCENPLLA